MQRDLLIQFGGHGTPWLREISKYRKEDGFKVFFAALAKGIKTAVEHTGSDLVNPEQIFHWIDNPESAPSPEELYAAPVSLTMIQAVQFAHLHAVRLAGALPILKNRVSILTGHSQGLFPATALSLEWSGMDAMLLLEQYTAFMLALGIRIHEVYPWKTNADVLSRAQENGARQVSPMLVVLGSDEKTVQEILNHFSTNNDNSLELALVNSPANQLVVGHTDELLSFYLYFQQAHAGSQLIFLDASVPFHSTHLKQALHTFLEKDSDLPFPQNTGPTDYAITSFTDEILTPQTDLRKFLSASIATEHLRWSLALAQVPEKRIQTVVDFGPGKVSARLSQENLGEQPLEYFHLAVPREREKFLSKL